MDADTVRMLMWCVQEGALWMSVGVYLGGRLYPGYSHRQQAMSELGARGRPTERIHPFINNYPIGILFTVFGVGIAALADENTLMSIAGWLLIAHGLAHIVAGIFPLDSDLGAGGAVSTTHKLHGIAGLVMYFALWFACLMWPLIEIPAVEGFVAYSLVSAIASFVSLVLMVRSLRSGRSFGLHQRISYGILAAWCAVLGIALGTN